MSVTPRNQNELTHGTAKGREAQPKGRGRRQLLSNGLRYYRLLLGIATAGVVVACILDPKNCYWLVALAFGFIRREHKG